MAIFFFILYKIYSRTSAESVYCIPHSACVLVFRLFFSLVILSLNSFVYSVWISFIRNYTRFRTTQIELWNWNRLFIHLMYRYCKLQTKHTLRRRFALWISSFFCVYIFCHRAAVVKSDEWRDIKTAMFGMVMRYEKFMYIIGRNFFLSLSSTIGRYESHGNYNWINVWKETTNRKKVSRA